MTFAELVQSKLPTRYLGARIEKVDASGDVVRATVEGGVLVIVTAEQMRAAKVDPAREKWEALRAVLGVQTAAAPNPFVRPAEALRAADAQAKTATPDPEPPRPPRWRSGLDGKLYPPPDPPRAPFSDEWKPYRGIGNRTPKALREAKKQDIVCAELGIAALRKTMHETAQRGLTDDGLLRFDGGAARDGYFVYTFATHEAARLAADAFPEPIREGWLLATPKPPLRDLFPDRQRLIWKIEVGLVEGHDPRLCGICRGRFADGPPKALLTDNSLAGLLDSGLRYDVDPALPPGTAELRTEREVTRICNVDVPPSPATEALTAANAPAPEEHDCPHFKVDYPRFRYEPEAPFTAPPPIRTTIVASPDDCPECLLARIEKLRDGLERAVGALTSVVQLGHSPGDPLAQEIRDGCQILLDDRKHFRP